MTPCLLCCKSIVLRNGVCSEKRTEYFLVYTQSTREAKLILTKLSALQRYAFRLNKIIYNRRTPFYLNLAGDEPVRRDSIRYLRSMILELNLDRSFTEFRIGYTLSSMTIKDQQTSFSIR